MKTILLVDDDDLFRRALKEELECDGFSVIEAANGTEAMERLDDTVDLALIDYALPDATGLTLLSHVKTKRLRCPVILMTAYAEKDTRTEAIRGGVYQYLDKLDDFAHILQTVRSALHLEESGDIPPFG